MKCPPAPSWETMFAPCPRCGATTEDQAGGICQPGRDETGEATCPGEFDRNGASVLPSNKYLTALDAWIDLHHDCNGECRAPVSAKD